MTATARTALVISALLLLSTVLILAPTSATAPESRDDIVDSFKSIQGYIDLDDYLHGIFYGEIGGSPYGDSLGQSMTAGDLDGDGYVDLVMTAMYGQGYDDIGSGDGEVYIFFSDGPDDFTGEHDMTLESPDVVIKGGNDRPEEIAISWTIGSECHFGHDIAIGDFNKDGIDDIATSAPDISVREIPAPFRAISTYGEVYIFYGRARGAWPATIDARNQNDVMWWASEEADRLGASLAAGDFDNDGWDDLLVGAPGKNDCVNTGFETVTRGGAYLLFGANDQTEMGDTRFLGAGAQLKDGHELPLCKYFQASGVEGRGGAGVTMGDVNNDTYDDVIIGTPESVGGQYPNTGSVDVIIGRGDRTTVPSLNELNQSSNLTLWGPNTHDKFGTDICTGDVDGDGKEDIIIGTPGADGVNNDVDESGEAWIVWGKNHVGSGLAPYGSNDGQIQVEVVDGSVGAIRVVGDDEDDQLGQKVFASDLDKDNRTEVFCSAMFADGFQNERENSGEVVVVYGKDRGDLPSIIKESRGNTDAIILGGVSFDILGGAMEVFDVNRDGIMDILISAVEADGPDGNRRNCGEIYILTVLPFGTRGMFLLDGYDVPTQALSGGKTCFAGYREYNFRMMLTSAWGMGDIDTVNLTIGPGVINYDMQIDVNSVTFTEVSDPLNVITLNSSACSVTPGLGDIVNIDLTFGFDWNFPTEDLINCTAEITNMTGKQLTDTFANVFQVENDLDLEGNAKLMAASSGNATQNGSWVRNSEPVTATGLVVVYEGSDQCFPHVDDYKVTLTSQVPTQWTFPERADGRLQMEFLADNAFVDTALMEYEVDIIEIGGATGPAHAMDRSNVNWTLRTDGVGPEIEGLRLVEGSQVVDGVAYVHSTSANITYDEVIETNYIGAPHSRWGPYITNDTMGVRDIYATTEDAFDEANATPFRSSGGLTGRYYDAENFDELKMVRTDPVIDFTTDDWGTWGPTETMNVDWFTVRWTGYLYTNYTSTYNFYLTVDNDARLWIDGFEVYDSWDKTGSGHIPLFMEKGFHTIRLDYRERVGIASCSLEWQVSTLDREVIPAYNLFHVSDTATLSDIAQGENTVSVWSVDWLGNIGSVQTFDLLIDTVVPTVTADFDDSEWINTTYAMLDLNFIDAESAIDLDTIEFWFDGGTRYQMNTSNISSVDLMDPTAGYEARVVVQDLTSGDHALGVQCSDRAQNPSVAHSFGYKVDVTEPVVTLQDPGRLWDGYDGQLNFSAYDHHSGLDDGWVGYRLYIAGGADWSNWVDLDSWIDIDPDASTFEAIVNFSLPLGTGHKVQVGVRDAAGHFNVSEEFTIDIEIMEINYPPVIVLASPVMNSSYEAGKPLLFSAEGTWDPNPSDNSSLSFSWYKSGVELFGSSMKFNETLPTGNYTFILTVSDGVNDVSLMFWIEMLSPEDWQQHIDDPNGTGGGGGGGGSGGNGSGEDGDDGGFVDTATSNPMWIVIVIVVLLLVGTAIVLFLFMGKKKQKREYGPPDEEEEEEEEFGEDWIDQRPQAATTISEEELAAQQAAMYGEPVAEEPPKDRKKGRGRKGGRKGRKKQLEADEPEALPPASEEVEEDVLGLGEEEEIEVEEEDEFMDLIESDDSSDLSGGDPQEHDEDEMEVVEDDDDLDFDEEDDEEEVEYEDDELDFDDEEDEYELGSSETSDLTKSYQDED